MAPRDPWWSGAELLKIVSVPEGASEQEGQATFKIIAPVDAPDTPVVYSNYVQASATPEDLTFHFGWYTVPPLTEPPPGEVEIRVRPVLKLSVPLSLVRGIIRVLENQLAAWEQSFGQPVPPHPNPPPGVVPERSGEVTR